MPLIRSDSRSAPKFPICVKTLPSDGQTEGEHVVADLVATAADAALTGPGANVGTDRVLRRELAVLGSDHPIGLDDPCVAQIEAPLG